MSAVCISFVIHCLPLMVRPSRLWRYTCERSYVNRWRWLWYGLCWKYNVCPHITYPIDILFPCPCSEACGGPNRASVYSSVPVVALPIPIAMKTDLPGKWAYAGCLREPATGKMFPNQIIWIGNNSALACMNQCAAFGYPASGVEVSQKGLFSMCSQLIYFTVWSRMLCVSNVF